MSAIFRNGHIYASAQALPIDAEDVRYSNSETGLTSDDAQGAIDELYDLVQQAGGTDTTYTLSVGTGADANKIVLTPSSGTADKITVPYATSAGDAATVNGKTVGVNVPSDAVFTDNNTTYTLSVGTGDDANKIILTPSSGNVIKITVPYASNSGTVNGKTVAESVPSGAVFTDTTYTLTQSQSDGHILTFTPSSGSPTTITIPDNNTTYDNLNQFSNADTKFITNAVNDLTNYYKKTETYTQTEVNALISAIPKFSIEVVDSLLIDDPSPTTIYLLLNTTTSTQNLYTEYIYIIPETGDPYFEKLGEQTVDLSGYYTSSQVDTLLSAKADSSSLGTAAAKGVDTSISAGSTSVNLPTSGAVASFVEGKGYVTTDTNTTYGLSVGTGDDANKIVLTPSSGNADKITVPYATNAGTVNGKTVAVNVPADAVFTDNNTTYTLSAGSGDDAQKVILTPSSGNTQKVTVPYATNAGDAQTVKGNDVPVDFEGTQAQWNALTTDQKKTYDRAMITDDYELPDHMAANEITYSNSSSGISASNVQDAIDVVNAKVITSDATTSAHGLMSASDKTKLNGVATGANAVSVASGSARGAISVTTNGTAASVGVSGVYFGRAGSVTDLNLTGPIEGGNVAVTIDQPFTSFTAGDRLVVFFYNEYVKVDGDADNYNIKLYVNGSSTGIPVLRAESLQPLTVTYDLPVKQGIAYTFTYATVSPIGNCFVVNEIPDNTIKYVGTQSGWSSMSTAEKKTYDMVFITND